MANKDLCLSCCHITKAEDVASDCDPVIIELVGLIVAVL